MLILLTIQTLKTKRRSLEQKKFDEYALLFLESFLGFVFNVKDVSERVVCLIRWHPNMQFFFELDAFKSVLDPRNAHG